jgi:hypothetical protein
MTGTLRDSEYELVSLTIGDDPLIIDALAL